MSRFDRFILTKILALIEREVKGLEGFCYTRRVMRWLVVATIKFYRRLPLPTHAACRFTPTCSAYTLQAVQKYGSIKGLWLGLKRVVRCNPFCKGGYDPLK